MVRLRPGDLNHSSALNIGKVLQGAGIERRFVTGGKLEAVEENSCVVSERATHEPFEGVSNPQNRRGGLFYHLWQVDLGRADLDEGGESVVIGVRGHTKFDDVTVKPSGHKESGE
jgi:hypothetical protein